MNYSPLFTRLLILLGSTTHLNDEVKRITRKDLNGEVAAGGHQGLKAGPRSRDTATTHAACFISSPLRPASSL